MVLDILEKLKKRWEENLQKQALEVDRILDPLHERFVASGIHIPVWRSLGSKVPVEGIVSNGFLGYGEIGGVWGLLVKTIEHDDKTGAVLGCRIDKLGALSPFIKEAIGELQELLKEMELLLESRIQELKTVEEMIRANLK